MNGFEMYGKVMKVHRAKTHSDETVKRKAGELFEDHKRKRLMLKGAWSPLIPSTKDIDMLTNLNRLQARRRRRKSASQPRRRREAARSQNRRRRRPRRIRKTEQDALPAEHPPRRGRRRPHDHLRALRRLQGSATGVRPVRGFCRIRERAVCYHGQGGDSEQPHRRRGQTYEGHVPTSAVVGYLRMDFCYKFNDTSLLEASTSAPFNQIQVDTIDVLSSETLHTFYIGTLLIPYRRLFLRSRSK
jgi:hypothetical protein